MQISKLSSKELLETKISDLELSIPRLYAQQLNKLNFILISKKILWTPKVWIADEWFSPDGIGGFAIPFTLCHPKLRLLEKKILGYCEGNSPKEFFKLACHETGHAIDNAYKLRLRKRRQQIFGLTSKRYPASYTPNPNSKNYVTHLEDFYAQAHPDEDWAETFAVWLSTDNWKQKYTQTKALDKLLYLDSVMSSIKNTPSQNCKESQYFNYQYNHKTVEQFLLEKRANLKLNRKQFYAQKIKKEFTTTPEGLSASKFLQQNKKKMINSLARSSKKDIWTLEKCFEDIRKECKIKKYHLKYSEEETAGHLVNLVNYNYNSFVKNGRTRIYM